MASPEFICHHQGHEAALVAWIGGEQDTPAALASFPITLQARIAPVGTVMITHVHGELESRKVKSFICDSNY